MAPSSYSRGLSCIPQCSLVPFTASVTQNCLVSEHPRGKPGPPCLSFHPVPNPAGSEGRGREVESTQCFPLVWSLTRAFTHSHAYSLTEHTLTKDLRASATQKLAKGSGLGLGKWHTSGHSIFPPQICPPARVRMDEWSLGPQKANPSSLLCIPPHPPFQGPGPYHLSFLLMPHRRSLPNLPLPPASKHALPASLFQIVFFCPTSGYQPLSVLPGLCPPLLIPAQLGQC